MKNLSEPGHKKRTRGRPRSQFAETPSSMVKALDRGLQVLRVLSQNGAMTLSDIAGLLKFPVSTAHRLLSTLNEHGFVEFNSETQEWSVGIEAFRIGSTYLVRTNLVEASRTALRSLMDETGETANLAIMDDGDVVFVSQIESHYPIRAFFRSGTRGHMHSSGIGKALLANMPEKEAEKIFKTKGLPPFTDKTLTGTDALFRDLEKTRKRGWSLDDEERYSGMRCVAAPIYNAHGEAIAGISVSGPTVRFSDQTVTDFAAKVMAAAQRVTQMIGGKGPEKFNQGIKEQL